MNPAGAWNRFWHAKGSPVPLASFRILFSVCLLREVFTGLAENRAAIAGLFHLPYVFFIQPVSETVYAWMHYLQFPCIALLGLGLLTQPALAGLLVLQGYIFFADQMVFRNHPYFFLLILGVLLVSPADKAWAVTARKGRRATVPLTAQRLIQVQLCLVYAFAGLHKLNGHYLEGNVLRHLAERGQAVFPEFFLAGRWPSMMAVAIVVFELSFPVAVWFRRTRFAWLGMGVMFHLGIALSMEIWTFTVASLAAYLLFLDPFPFAASRKVQGICVIEA